MSGRFVRASKFRHVYGQPAKKENCYDNVRVTKNAWDSALIKVNPKYLSVNWDSSGGGSFAVIPLNEVGRLPDLIPLFRGHTAAVLDTDWNPFDDEMVVSGAEDGQICIWKVPKDFTVKPAATGDDEPVIVDVSPEAKLTGHQRKVGQVLFHPVAENILASSSADYTVKIWNIETGKLLYSLPHKDIITAMTFSHDGNRLATASKDKRIRVWDIRQEKILSEGPGHGGGKSMKLVWLGDSDRIFSTGFSRMSDREIALWDASDIASGAIGGTKYLDGSSGISLPFYDEGTKMIYLAGKGDGNIKYYEFQNDELFHLSDYGSIEPQRGVCALPKRAVKVHEHEVFRFYKTVGDSLVEPLSFFVPRKGEGFQEDIYPDALAPVAALSAAEWAAGKSSAPKYISLADVYNGVDKPTLKDAAEATKLQPPVSVTSSPSKKSNLSSPEKKAQEPEPAKDMDEALTSSKKVQSMLDNVVKPDEPTAKDEGAWDSEPEESNGKLNPSAPIDENKVNETADKVKSEPETAAKKDTDPVEEESTPASQEESKSSEEESQVKEEESQVKEEESQVKEEESQVKVEEPKAEIVGDAVPRGLDVPGVSSLPIVANDANSMAIVIKLLQEMNQKIESLEKQIVELKSKV